MLLQLTIRNFALIDAAEIEFVPGLNVITGETGAGKSILVDALGLALGERSDLSLIRDKTKPCSIEAVFSPAGEAWKERLPFLNGLSGEDCIILRREIGPEGRNKNYINQQFVNLACLKEAGRALVDIHSQYDQQALMDPRRHGEYIDSLAGMARPAEHPAMTSYQMMYAEYAALLEKKQDLMGNRENREREVDLLKYQIREIEEIHPEEGEEERLREEKIRLVHAEKLHALTTQILESLNEGDAPVSNQLSDTFRPLAEWMRIDASQDDLRGQFESVQLQVEAIIRAVENYREKLSYDSGRLDEIEDRLRRLGILLRKYGPDVSAVRAFLEMSRRRLNELLHAEDHQKDIEIEIEKRLPALLQKAGEITRLREKACRLLSKTVEKDLRDLGIQHARFECRLEAKDPGPSGQDEIEFMISPNAGEPLRPLAEIASGGEASRTLLAVKHALAEAESTATLIFDEIDANVGGRLGHHVGQKLKEMAGKRQLIVITHLAQIASFAEHHIRVKKSAGKGKTRIDYAVLEGAERVQEIAQMMSGERETEISKMHAEEMLKSVSP